MPSAAPPDAPTRSGAVGVALRIVLPLTACCALLVALVVARWPPLMDVDASLARTTHRWALSDTGLTHANRTLTDWVWDPWTMRLLAAGAAGWLLWRGAWRLALWLAVTCACGTLVQQGIKAVVDRPRPVWRHPVDSAHYAAFPSGHAMTATVVCGALLWAWQVRGAGRGTRWRLAVGAAVVSVIGVGLTRTWLGVHWPSDVLGGWLLGALVVAVATLCTPRGAGGSQQAGTAGRA